MFLLYPFAAVRELKRLSMKRMVDCEEVHDEGLVLLTRVSPYPSDLRADAANESQFREHGKETQIFSREVES